MQHYHKVSILFHWLVGLMIIGLLALGLIMVELPKPDKYAFYGWHKAFGIIVLVLVVLRLGWRLKQSPPPLPESTPAYQKLASTLTHWALYVMMLFMPLIGWVMSSAGGHPVSVFGLPIPAIVEKDKELGGLANSLHEIGGYVFIALIALHIGAAFFHHFIQKDGLLHRIWPKKG